MILCKVVFLWQKSQQISEEYSPERFEKVTGICMCLMTLFKGVLKLTPTFKVMT